MQIDPLTGERFIPTRSNQKFASRANQIKYNNQLAKKRREAIKPHSQILVQNRNILIKILGKETRKTVSRDYLLGAGFNFLYYTQSCKSGDKAYQCIFEFGLCQYAPNQYELRKIK